MYFNEVLGIKEIKDKAVTTREAVRAISIKNNKILMIKTNKGDYKLPGGGIKKLESHKEALKREISEETGYDCVKVGDLVGIIIERNKDLFDENKIFEMTSYYYLCNISDKNKEQLLDDYEKELGFEPIWVDINESIENNKKHENIFDKNRTWLKREIHVLHKIKDIFF